MEDEEMESLEGNTTVNAAAGRASKIGLIAGAVGAGALLMYLFDPERGKGRRARLNEQLTSQANRLASAAGAKARHLSNRAQGVAHNWRLLNAKRSETTEAL
jgi:hypothetical protein